MLSLPEPTPSSPPPSIPEVKAAYKRALLLHHPDKSVNPKVERRCMLPTPTVDEITFAYRVLSSSTERDAYTRKILAQRRLNVTPATSGLALHDGNEIVDLEDMQYDHKERVFFRSCRCGRSRGYHVSEAELEERLGAGEVSVGCEGCSLIIRIEFEAAEDGII